ncbi:MAG: response regulator [Balneolales bacterium]
MLNKILYIEDDAVTQMLFAALNRRASFAEDVISAYHGQQAIDYYEELLKTRHPEYPSLILLDLNMPVMDGWQFLDEYMRRYARYFDKTRVVIVTSSDDKKDLEKAKRFPIVRKVLPKPLTPDVITTLSKLLS